jgi:hypothetical protein
MFFDFMSTKNDAIPVKPFPANTEHCLVFCLKGFVAAFELLTYHLSISDKNFISATSTQYLTSPYTSIPSRAKKVPKTPSCTYIKPVEPKPMRSPHLDIVFTNFPSRSNKVISTKI